jgi:carbamoylphosphate synthase large subunit
VKSALILGDYKLDRLVAPLVRRGYQVAVWSAQQPPRACGAPVRWHRRTSEITEDTAGAIVREVQPDLVLPNIYGETEEHALLSYATVADGRWYVHPPPFAEICVDKVALHELCSRWGIRSPPGRVCRDDSSLLDFARAFAPVVIKQARSQARHGIWHCASAAAVKRLLSVLRYPVLAQKSLQGEELAVEVLSTSHGWARFPVMSSGALDGSLEPQRRLRVVPRPLDPPRNAELNHIITELHTRLRPNGIWQLDLAMSDGHVHLLEVNGRPGGVSDLSRAVSGVDPHEVSVSAALGEAIPQLRQRRVAMAVPLVPGSQIDKPNWWRGEFRLERYDSEPNWRLTVATDDPADLPTLIESVEQKAFTIGKSELARRIMALCQGVGVSGFGKARD